jgi:hypothetical protein
LHQNHNSHEANQTDRERKKEFKKLPSGIKHGINFLSLSLKQQQQQ